MKTVSVEPASSCEKNVQPSCVPYGSSRLTSGDEQIDPDSRKYHSEQNAEEGVCLSEYRQAEKTIEQKQSQLQNEQRTEEQRKETPPPSRLHEQTGFETYSSRSTRSFSAFSVRHSCHFSRISSVSMPKTEIMFMNALLSSRSFGS